MTHVTFESKLRSVGRSSMHPCQGNRVAIGRVVVCHALAAHAFSAEIKCRHCSVFIFKEFVNNRNCFLYYTIYPYILEKIVTLNESRVRTWNVVPYTFYKYKSQQSMKIRATLLNPDMCNPDFRLNRTVWKAPVPSYTYNSYAHNPDFA